MRRPRILVVDDDRDLREMIKLWLSSIYDVDGASNAEKGLALVRQNRPDVLVLDIMMPRVSGLDLMWKLRSMEELATLPVVLVSAYADIKDTDEIGPLQPWFFLSKPFARTELIRRIDDLLLDSGWGEVDQQQESRARAALAKNVLTEFERQGLSIVKAVVGEHSRPPLMHGQTPDVVGFEPKRGIVRLGVGVSAATLQAPRTRKRIVELATVLDQDSHGDRVELALLVPKGMADDATTLLRLLGLFDRPAQDVLVMEAPMFDVDGEGG